MEFQGVAQRIYSSFQNHGKCQALPDLTYDEFAALVEQCRDYLRQFSRPKQCIAIWNNKNSKSYAFWIAAWLERRSIVFLSEKMGRSAIENIRTMTSPTIEIRGDEELPFVENPAENLSPPRKDISAADIAYYIATSGSTGDPKIIAVSQASLEAWIVNSQSTWDVSAEDRVSQIFDLTFDPSISDVLWAFLSGACLVPLLPFDFINIDSWVRKNKLTIWSSSPSIARAFLLKPHVDTKMLSSIRRATFIGEMLTSQFVREWKACLPNVKVENHYGPAECVISVSRVIIEDNMLHDSIMPIGKPYPGVDFIKNSEGELLIQSSQVAEGYLGQLSPAFDVSTNSRLYNSGDQANQLSSGDWQVTGRADSQIKINGQRWEAEGIESLFERHLLLPVYVQKWTEGSEGIDLVILGAPGSSMRDDLEAVFEKELPSSLRPRNIWVRGSAPLNASGKKDRQLLKQELDEGKLNPYE